MIKTETENVITIEVSGLIDDNQFSDENIINTLNDMWYRLWNIMQDLNTDPFAPNPSNPRFSLEHYGESFRATFFYELQEKKMVQT